MIKFLKKEEKSKEEKKPEEKKVEKREQHEVKEEKKQTPKLKLSLLPVRMTFSELLKRKDEMETLLSSLEDEYREATVSEKSYKEIKQKNLEKLEEVKKRIEEMQKSAEGHAFAPEPQTIRTKVEALEPKPETPETHEENEIPSGTIERAKPFSVVITPVTKEEFEETTKDLRRLTIDLEKMKTLIETIKETRTGTEEKIQRLTESLGEIRSMSFQKEAEIGEMEAKVEKLNEIIGELKPEKIATELGKRDKEIGMHEARIEKMEIKTDDVLKRTKEIQSVLDSIGNLENIVNVSKTVAEKTVKIDKNMKEIERMTDKVQKLYVELSKKLEEFTVYKSKQDGMEELVQELVKTIDQINIKFDEYAKAEDVTSLKESLTTIDKELQENKKQVSVVEALPLELQTLQKQKEEVEMLLSSVEDEYKNRGIPESEYIKIKENNLKKLEDINKQIKKTWKTLKPPAEEGIPPLEIKTEEKVEEPISQELSSISEIKPEPVEVKTPLEAKQELKPKDKKGRMVMELQDLFTKGLITQSAFERTKKMLIK